MSRATTPPPTGPRWWVSDNGKTDGPYSQAYIAACLAAGQYSSATMLCLEGSEKWQPISTWPQFQSQSTSHESIEVPQRMVTTPASNVYQRGSKSESGKLSSNAIQWIVVAVLLACFMAWLYYPRGRGGTDEFEQRLIGAWTSTDVTLETPPRTVAISITFAPDYSYQMKVKNPLGKWVHMAAGTWRLYDDPNLDVPNSSRAIELGGDLAGNHSVLFGRDSIFTSFQPETSGEMREWKRAKAK